MLPHRVGVGTFISAGRSLETALQRVERAESLGYESVYTTHIAARDSLVVLAAYSTRTERIKLGTGVLPIYSRTPVATAQAAATIDELSGGRMVLGLGVAHQVTVENWFGSTIGKPVAEMREYVGAVRAMFRGEDPNADAERFPTRFRFMGYEPRPDLPVYVAALSPERRAMAAQLTRFVIRSRRAASAPASRSRGSTSSPPCPPPSPRTRTAPARRCGAS